MDAAHETLAARGCSVLVVCHAKPEVLAHYIGRKRWHVPIVSDPERTAYQAFTLARTRWWTFFRPGVVWGYLRGMLRGYGLKIPYAGEDVLQLGGDFLLDRNRRVLFSYPSATPTDRPSVRSILAAIPSVTPMS